MKIDTFFKASAYALLNGSGISISPDQLGLKGGSIPTTGPFAQFLQANNGLGLPTPPTPPSITDDMSAEDKLKFQTQYNQDLLTYNQNFQAYHTRLLQMMILRFQQAQLNQNQASTASASAVGSTPDYGFGDILGVDDL